MIGVNKEYSDQKTEPQDTQSPSLGAPASIRGWKSNSKTFDLFWYTHQNHGKTHIQNSDTKTREIQTVSNCHCCNPMIGIFTNNTHILSHTHAHIRIHTTMIDTDMYSIIPSLCGLWSRLLWLETDRICSLPPGIQYDISYWRKEWINSDAQSAETPPVWLFDTMQLLHKRDTHMAAFVDLHHKKHLLADEQVSAEKDGSTLEIKCAHFPAPWIGMPPRPQSRSDNKSHFRHVCQVFRRHLSPGWMWWVGSEQSKQRHRYPPLIESATPHQLPTNHPWDMKKTLENLVQWWL